MNLRKLIVLSVGALAIVGSTVAEARPYHRHGGGRAFLYAAPLIAAGAILAARPYYRSYYGPSYYYPPAPVYYSPPPPPVYIEQAPTYTVPPQQYQPQLQPQYSVPPQSQAEPQSQPQADWYYCAESQAYYPYVKQCAAGWQQVAPQARN